MAHLLGEGLAAGRVHCAVRLEARLTAEHLTWGYRLSTIMLGLHTNEVFRTLNPASNQNLIPFQSSQPNRSYKKRGDRIVEVDAKVLVEDENRTNQLGFAMHKARLKAQMMIETEPDPNSRTALKLPPIYSQLLRS